MRAQRKKTLRVFVIKNVKLNGIVEDDIIETEPCKFKSIRFRHTFYQSQDFVKTIEEVYSFLEITHRAKLNIL